MARLRWYALTAVGGLVLAYQLLAGAIDVWTLVVIPLYAVGAWLAWRLPTHPQAVGWSGELILAPGRAAMPP